MSDLTKYIKQLALDANEANKPTTIMTGTVTSEKPLKILVEQKLELNESMLILTKNVTDYEVDITVSMNTVSVEHTHNATHVEENDTSVKPVWHLHPIKGRKKIKVHNGLKTDDKVLLIRISGGQKFVVLDKISPHTVEGEWV